MMARARCTFLQQDVTRALRAAKAAGVTVDVKIHRRSGDLVVSMQKTDEPPANRPASEPEPPEDIIL
jgi:hypothetical protein